MRRITVLASLAILSILLLAGCDSGPEIARVDGGSVILAFGDSLTHGNGAPRGQSYPNVLGELLDVDVINAGVPGETTAEGLRRLPAVLDRHQPTLVILCEGGNDFLRRLSQERAADNLRRMVQQIRDRGADLILVGVPKLGFGLEVPKFYPAIAREYAIPYEGEILLALLGDKEMKSDDIHPNATGYRLMAEAIHEVISASQRK